MHPGPLASATWGCVSFCLRRRDCLRQSAFILFRKLFLRSNFAFTALLLGRNWLPVFQFILELTCEGRLAKRKSTTTKWYHSAFVTSLHRIDSTSKPRTLPTMDDIIPTLVMHTGSSTSCIGFAVDVQPYASFKSICAGNMPPAHSSPPQE